MDTNKNPNNSTEINGGEQNAPVTNQYIEEIQKLKQSTVSRTDYDQLLADNKQLLEAIVNGQPMPQSQEPKKLRDYQEIAKELATADYLSAKEFLNLSEEFRESMIQQRGVDPWLYHGSSDHVEYTQEDYDNLEAIEGFIEHMHQYDNQDKEHYIAEVNRITPKKKTFMKG